jgi:hypothetical protein
MNSACLQEPDRRQENVLGRCNRLKPLGKYLADVIGHAPVKDIERCDPLDAAAVKELVQGDIIQIGLEHLVELLS